MECSIRNELFSDDATYYVKRIPDNALVDPVEDVEHNGIVCQECYEEEHRCEGCSNKFVEDDGRTDSGGEFWCHDCYGSHFSTCSYCEREVWMDDTFYDDGYVCDNCSDEHYFLCNCCDEYTHNDTGHDTVDGRVCSSCYDNGYTTCSCGDTIHNEDWCYACGHCERCCTCDSPEDLGDADDDSTSYQARSATCIDEVTEDVPPSYHDYARPPEPIRANQNCSLDVPEDVPPSYHDYARPPEPIRANQNCSLDVPEPLRAQPVGGTSTGMPALIQTLDNSAFTLNDTNIKAVLGMLDKSKKLKVGDITGRHCTANDSYFQLPRMVAEVGKVKKPRYFYGVRSNEYDIVLNHSTRDIVDKLTGLGLTYHVGTGDKTKVGLSFKVRKRKYDTCITFLKFLCAK